jgi:hypothetical protein
VFQNQAMESHSAKYARLIKSNTLYSFTGLNPGCEDAILGVRCKTKAEIITSRRFKRESITDQNRTRIIKAADDDDDDDDLIEKKEKEESLAKSTTPSATIFKSNASFKTTPMMNVTQVLSSTKSNLSRANTIATNNRKKLLDEWRKKREDDKMRENLGRTAFKVCHVDVKDYALPHTTPSIAKRTTQLPTSQFTFKVTKCFYYRKNIFFLK